MKQVIAIIFGITICLLVPAGCGGSEKRTTMDDCPVVAHADGSGLVVCDLASVRDSLDMPMSLLCPDLEIIRLENSDEALIGDGNVWISEHYLGAYSYDVAAYKFFSRTGKFLGVITTRGQGPNEFVSGIYDSYIDESEGKIYILSMRATKIMVFDFQGNALPPIPLPFIVHKGRIKISAGERTLVVMALPFSDTPCVVWKQDFDGNIISSIPAGQFVIDPGDYNNELFAAFYGNNMTYYLSRWVAQTDSLYHYSEVENRLTPAFTVQLIDEDEKHTYMELPGHYVIYRSVDKPGSPMVLVDKQTLKGAYVRLRMDMLGDIPGEMMRFANGYGIANMHPSNLKEQLEAAIEHPEKLRPEMLQQLTALNESITDNDNNIVLLGKLK
ncbi:MAG: 6-bladed beta-propeller [Tannerellaceae bacterium]|jgi:hypothetical protein|nr:6-bladed beta-propeller [Tannerellaceae bacterium]